MLKLPATTLALPKASALALAAVLWAAPGLGLSGGQLGGLSGNFFLGASSAWAQTAPSPISIRAGLTTDGARVVFEWPLEVTAPGISSRVSGNRAILTFNQAVAGNLASLPGRLPGWVTRAVSSEGGRIVTLITSRPVEVKAVTMGQRVLVDLRTQPPKPTAPAAGATPPPQPAAKPAPAALPTEAKTPPAVTPPSVPAVAPAPVAAPSSAASTAPVTPTPVMAPTTDTAPPPKAAPLPPAPTVQALLAADQATTATTAAPPPSDAAPSPPLASGNKITLMNGKPIQMALFQRGSSYYLVLPGSPAAAGNLSAVIGNEFDAGKASFVPARGGMVLKLQPPDNMPDAKLLSASNGTGWVIEFGPRSAAPKIDGLPVTVQPSHALGPRVLLPAKDVAAPVVFIDPVVGDQLTVVPLGARNQMLPVSSKFAQFELLPTAQGVVVRPLADSVTVNNGAQGVEISAAVGLQLGEAFVQHGAPPPTANAADFASKDAATSSPDLPALLPLEKWGQPAGAKFTTRRQDLALTIADTPLPKRNAAYLDLAHFYFVNGMGTEAAAVWQIVAATDEKLLKEPEYNLLRAIAAFYTGTPVMAREALMAINAPNVDSALWQGLLEAEARNWPEAARNYRPALRRIWDYPDPYRTRLALGAIETALNVGSAKLAGELLDYLKKATPPVLPSTQPALDYFSGVIAYQNNDLDGARSYLNLAASSWNQLWRVRAELALIDLDAREEKSTPQQIAERLERLRFAWRGDALEYDVMERMAKAHVATKNYAVALEEYTHLKERFPEDTRSSTIPETQKGLFAAVFDGPDRDSLPTYSQLAIWDKYADFRPTDPQALNNIRLYLVDRITKLDLLGHAGSMLKDVIKDTPDLAEKARLGLRAAGLSLLDRKPADALDMLAFSAPAANEAPLPEDVAYERNLLAAKAKAELGKLDEALASLADDYSDVASRLRVDITWKAQKWPEAAAALSALTTPRPDSNSGSKDKKPTVDANALSGEMPVLLLRQATALALAGDRDGLDRLRDNYGAKMEKTTLATAFRLLTRPESAGGLPDRGTLQSRISEVQLFQSFLEKYRDSAAAVAN